MKSTSRRIRLITTRKSMRVHMKSTSRRIRKRRRRTRRARTRRLRRKIHFPRRRKCRRINLQLQRVPKKESTSQSAADAKKEPSKGSSWPLVETEAAATPDTLTSVVAAKPRGSPPALAAFAAALMMVALGVFVRRQLQKTAIELEDGPDMYSAYTP